MLELVAAIIGLLFLFGLLSIAFSVGSFVIVFSPVIVLVAITVLIVKAIWNKRK